MLFTESKMKNPTHRALENKVVIKNGKVRYSRINGIGPTLPSYRVIEL